MVLNSVVLLFLMDIDNNLPTWTEYEMARHVLLKRGWYDMEDDNVENQNVEDNYLIDCKAPPSRSSKGKRDKIMRLQTESLRDVIHSYYVLSFVWRLLYFASNWLLYAAPIFVFVWHGTSGKGAA